MNEVPGRSTHRAPAYDLTSDRFPAVLTGISTSRVDGPSTRAVNSGSGNRALWTMRVVMIIWVDSEECNGEWLAWSSQNEARSWLYDYSNYICIFEIKTNVAPESIEFQNYNNSIRNRCIGTRMQQQNCAWEVFVINGTKALT